jgi:predicted enzyme related to lactoylglutathione lyase
MIKAIKFIGVPVSDQQRALDLATWRELVEKGVKFTQEPKDADWGTAAVFTDPDGNQFVLSSP